MKRVKAGGKDITEAVQILYDIAHQSMDWGSGFLDNEEMTAVVRLAEFMGWEPPPLDGQNDPQSTIARAFPDLYDVAEIQIPPSTYCPDGFVRLKITAKKQAAS